MISLPLFFASIRSAFTFPVEECMLYRLEMNLVSFDIRRTLQSQYSIDPVKDQVFRS